MSDTLKGLLLCTVFLTGFAACSSPQKTATVPKVESKKDYPQWFQANSFSADSTVFHGYAQAVAADSAVAVANAVLQARANLETGLANLLEEVRTEQEKSGVDVVTKKGFILSLRNAHQQSEQAAAKSNGAAYAKKGHYLGYAEVELTKVEVKDLLKKGLSSTYWNALAESPIFKERVGTP